MDSIGIIERITFGFLGRTISINPNMLIMTWIIMALLVFLSYKATKNLSGKPGKLQLIFELFYTAFKDLVDATLGEEHAKKYFPYIATLFIFILLSNYIGILPPVFHFLYIMIATLDNGSTLASGLTLGSLFVPGPAIYLLGGMALVYVFQSFKKKTVVSFSPAYRGFAYSSIALIALFNVPVKLPIPDIAYTWMLAMKPFEEPTKFLSTPLGLGILSGIIVHISAIKAKGIVGYFGSYNDPLPGKGIWLFFCFLNPFFYLNVIGEAAKVVSHSFRLFGNILGGSIIILIVSTLVKYIGLPVFLQAFFGLFSGGIQAFVFSMLAVTYIAVQVK